MAVSSNVVLQQSGAAMVVKVLVSRLDGAGGLPDFWEEVWAAIPSAGAAHMTVDLSAVAFVTSSGLAKLLALRKALLRNGGALTLCGLQPGVRAVMTTTRLDHLFTIVAAEA